MEFIDLLLVGRKEDQQGQEHLEDGRAVNQDGTFKHGTGEIVKTVKNWLKNYGWNFE